MIQGPTPGMGGGIQGPVASAGGGTPFQVQGPTPTAPPADSGQRVQSNRVYAIVFGAFLMVCFAVFVAVWLRPTGDSGEVTGSGEGTPEVVVSNSTKKKATGGEVDTALPPVEEKKPRTTRRNTTRKSTNSGSTSSSTTKKAAAAPSGPAPLTVKLATGANAFEVTCPSGFRQRTAISGGTGTLQGVPLESCTLFFKGGAPAKYGPVKGGQTLTCSITGTTAVCK